MLPTKFQVNQLFCSGEVAKNRFSFQDGHVVAILDFGLEQFWLVLIYKSSRCFLPSFKSIGLLVQEKKRKIDCQDGCHGGHLGFWIGTILAIFHLQVTSMFPTKFQVIWDFGSEEAKNRFSKWPPGGHLG